MEGVRHDAVQGLSSWIEIQANREALQDALNRKLNWTPPLAVDGDLGPLSMKALRAAYAKYGVPDSIHFDSRILPYLFEAKDPSMAENTIISGIAATGADYLANFISSKIVWVSGVVVVALDSWVTTHWGLTVPDTVNGWVTAGIATVGGLVVMWLRTFANKPKVVAGTTVTVVK